MHVGKGSQPSLVLKKRLPPLPIDSGMSYTRDQQMFIWFPCLPNASWCFNDVELCCDEHFKKSFEISRYIKKNKEVR